jgi:hypothetical protein
MVQKLLAGGRPRKWALWGVGAIAVVGVGFLVAPPLVRSMAESKLTELLHRPVTIEGLSINPYALSAEVRGPAHAGARGRGDGAELCIAVRQRRAESLFRGGAVVQEVKLVEPMVSVVRLEGRASTGPT